MSLSQFITPLAVSKDWNCTDADNKNKMAKRDKVRWQH
jgi:hypothetical protein